MNWNEYIKMVKSTKRYPNLGVTNLSYPLLKLQGEYGELLEKLQMGVVDTVAYQHELGDILWYVVAVHLELGVKPENTWVNRVYPSNSMQVVIYMARFYELIGKFERKGEGDFDRLRWQLANLWAPFTFCQTVLRDIDPNADFSLANIAKMNMAKLYGRAERNTIVGEGDNR